MIVYSAYNSIYLRAMSSQAAGALQGTSIPVASHFRSPFRRSPLPSVVRLQLKHASSLPLMTGTDPLRQLSPPDSEAAAGAGGRAPPPPQMAHGGAGMARREACARNRRVCSGLPKGAARKRHLVPGCGVSLVLWLPMIPNTPSTMTITHPLPPVIAGRK